MAVVAVAGEVCGGRNPDTHSMKFRYCSRPLAFNETDGQRPPSSTTEQTVCDGVGAWDCNTLCGDGIR